MYRVVFENIFCINALMSASGRSQRFINDSGGFRRDSREEVPDWLRLQADYSRKLVGILKQTF